MFMEARQEFSANDAEASTSQPLGERGRINDQDVLMGMLRTNQTKGKHKKVSSVMKFLKSMLNLLKDEGSILELGRFIAAYEKLPDVNVTKGKGPVRVEGVSENTVVQREVTKNVNQVSKKPQIARKF